MQGWWKLLIPLGLGAAAALLNYMGRTSDIEPASYVGLKKDLRAGEEITFNHLMKVDVPKTMSNLATTGIPYSQWAVLLGRRLRREMSKGDLVMWSDVAPKDPWDPEKVVLHLSLEGISLPANLEIGQEVEFILPDVFDRPLPGKDPKFKPLPVEPTTTYRRLGPYQVFNIEKTTGTGGFTRANAISLLVPAPREGSDFDKNVQELLKAAFKPVAGTTRGAFALYHPKSRVESRPADGKEAEVKDKKLDKDK